MSPIVNSFDWQAQHAFARLSGDSNPLHLDPLLTRRTPMGDPLVHGVHVLAWALDRALKELGAIAVQAVLARFVKPVFVGDCVTLTFGARTEDEIDLLVRVDRLVVMRVALSLRKQPESTVRAAAVQAIPRDHAFPLALGMDDMVNRSGAVALPDVNAVKEAFPVLAAAWNADRAAALIATTRLIGMECPGLHSLFLGLHLVLRPDVGSQHCLNYAVTNVDDRFRTVDIQVTGPGLDGNLNAMVRHPPVAQPRMTELSAAIPAGVFKDYHHQALIIGGSRGLGALTARLLAISGVKPIITYAVGRVEAEEVAADIGNVCEIMPFDVCLPAVEQLAEKKIMPTHLYYFATCHIFRRPAGYFSAEYFRDFSRFYVTGFASLVSALADYGTKNLKVFYPSSVAVEEPVKDLAEYAAAKAAGEKLCDHLNRFHPQVKVVVQRLPRVLTDQTATAANIEIADARSVMVPIIKAMHEKMYSD